MDLRVGRATSVLIVEKKAAVGIVDDPLRQGDGMGSNMEMRCAKRP
jgi:hypothetical protein